MSSEKNIIIFGAGAVGASVGGWLAPHYPALSLLDRPEIAQSIQQNGITLYPQGAKDQAQTVRVQVIENLNQVKTPDVIVLAVKNYSLEAVAKQIVGQVGDRPLIVALQNGIENQTILPKYFSKILYGVICYNAWLDAPGVVGYQKKGPLVLGATHQSLSTELQQMSQILNRGVETIVTEHLQDAVHSKMIINLTNSLTTLIGHPYQPVSDLKIFQKILTNLTYEGVQIVKAAGYHECSLGGMPSWRTIWAAAKLPQFFTRPIFNKNVKKMVVSSMAQDIVQRGGNDSELESLNGYFLKLADQYSLTVPFNRVIYRLCREEFSKPHFQPMPLRQVWEQISRTLS